jgi:hypothetical protein
MKLDFEVTKSTIRTSKKQLEEYYKDLGRKENPGNICPLGIAINKVIAKGYYATIGSQSSDKDNVRILKGNPKSEEGSDITVQTISLNKKLVAFIDAFDSNEKVEPIDFSLNIKKEFVKPKFH